MLLKEKLSTPRGNKTVTLQSIKCIANNLAMAHNLVSNKDLMVPIMNGIRAKFKELAVGLRAWESPSTFEELHDKFLDYEEFL